MIQAKYRAKRKLNGEWVYGSYIPIGDDWCHIVPTGTQYDDIDTLITSHKMRIITATVGRFTGKLDKNNKEIYEGDIVKSGNYTMLINYDEWGGLFRCKGNDQKYGLGSFNSPLYVWRQNQFEVIGNIHDNPELLP